MIFWNLAIRFKLQDLRGVLEGFIYFLGEGF